MCITNSLIEAQVFAESNDSTEKLSDTAQYHTFPTPKFMLIRSRSGQPSIYSPHMPERALPSRSLLSWPKQDLQFSKKEASATCSHVTSRSIRLSVCVGVGLSSATRWAKTSARFSEQLKLKYRPTWSTARRASVYTKFPFQNGAMHQADSPS